MYYILVLLCLSAVASTSTSNLRGQESIRWVPSSDIKESQLEPVGNWWGGKLYVGRAKVEGAWIPGKAYFRGSTFYVAVPWYGKELTYPDGQVLITRSGSTAWVKGQPGMVPTSAVIGGLDPKTDEATFICRASVVSSGKSYLLVGKLLTGRSHCKIPHVTEVDVADFEVLVVNP